MLKLYAYTCLLSALSVVEMKPLNINGHVGGNVNFTCSDWNVWTDETFNVKYFCNDPCSKDNHVIVKAAFGQTAYKKKIKITNRAEGLFVTFTNLQKSDSKTYICGLERSGFDSYIKVKLKVTDAVSSHPKTTPKTVVDGSTLSSAVTNSSSISSTSSDVITEKPTSYITLNTTSAASAAQRAGSIPYLIIGVIIIVTVLMVLLKIMHKTMKKQLKAVSSTDTPQENTHGDVEYDEIRPEDQTDPDCLYANYSCHQVTEVAAQSGNSYLNDVSLKSASRFEANSRGACEESRVTGQRCDLIYSVAQLPKEQTEPTVQSEPNQSENSENDFLYSLVQLPRAT